MLRLVMHLFSGSRIQTNAFKTSYGCDEAWVQQSFIRRTKYGSCVSLKSLCRQVVRFYIHLPLKYCDLIPPDVVDFINYRLLFYKLCNDRNLNRLAVEAQIFKVSPFAISKAMIFRDCHYKFLNLRITYSDIHTYEKGRRGDHSGATIDDYHNINYYDMPRLCGIMFRSQFSST